MIAVTAAVDLSKAISIKASLQAAADAGVLAAATALASGYGDADKQKIAEDTFYTNLSPKLLAAFPATPDVSIDFSTQTVRMDVVVDTDQLLTNLITDAVTIGITGTAMADKGSPVCLMALNETASGAIRIQGIADVEDCAVYVNSNHDQAMQQVGNAYAIAEGFCVHGSYNAAIIHPLREVTACANRTRWPRSSTKTWRTSISLPAGRTCPMSVTPAAVPRAARASTAAPQRQGSTQPGAGHPRIPRWRA